MGIMLDNLNLGVPSNTSHTITIMNNTYTSDDFYCFGCRWEVKGFANITN